MYATPPKPSPAAHRPEDLPGLLRDQLELWIDDRGISPAPCLFLDAEGRLNFASLACTPEAALRFVAAQVRSGCQGIAWGLDRFTKPGQGTELGDAFVGAGWDGRVWRPFVVEYRPSPRLLKPIDFGNAFWNDAVRRELGQCFGPGVEVAAGPAGTGGTPCTTRPTGRPPTA